MIYKFKTSCSKEKLREIRKFVIGVLEEYGLSDVDINKLVLAVDEICANLIIHSHNCNAEEFIELRIKIKKGEGITFEITDQGIGFNASNYAEPDLKDIVKQKKKGGVGLLLVKRIMDNIEFKSENSHNTCRLYKKLGG